MKYSIILFLIFTQYSFAQSVLKGRVLSFQDKTPLNYVTISIAGKAIAVQTDENGLFEIHYIIDPSDVIVFNRIGYITRKIQVKEFIPDLQKEIFLDNNLFTSQTILVRGSIDQQGSTPVTFSQINQEEIKQTYSVQDFPQLMNTEPSMTTYSENGNGIGYNYLSIRGFDQRRISVSINGVPQNDPEDHNVYWLDFPDLLETTQLIQIQRGSGSGIIGYPAVGGSINIITSSLSDKPGVELSSSIGSYNTRKYSAEFSSGLISNKYSFFGKISEILSSGYRNSSWTDLKSIYFSASRYDDNFTSQINVYGGPIADGLAYMGLPKFAIGDKTLRLANYSDWGENNGKYTYTVDRRPAEIENFSQPHFELLNELKISNKVTLNSSLFLVIGNGFFDYDGSWADTNYFRLTKANGIYPTQNPSNALIRAEVDNKQWGWIPRLSIKQDNGELILGGEMRIHRSLHWSSIIFADNLPTDLPDNYRFNSYNGGKDILNFYAHENYNLTNQLNILAELQLAYHRYLFTNEEFVGNNFSIKDTYLNPRIGVNYKFTNEWNTYISFTRVTREPRLINYYNADESSYGSVPQFEINSLGQYDFSKPFVKPETMNDLELGTAYTNDKLSLSLNFYYMLFNNEIVDQGQVDQFGQPITGNMERTIHYGMEAVLDYKVSKQLELILNGALSKNYISSGSSYITYSDSLTARIDVANNRISGFPDMSFNAVIKFNYEKFFAQFTAKYVGDFYTDNYGDKITMLYNNYPGSVDYIDNKVDSYFTANLYASYDLKANPVANNIKVFLQVNNLFDHLYAAYGIGKAFFPAAERNFLCGIKLGL
jgi:iron complex outermembrane receptor protein